MCYNQLVSAEPTNETYSLDGIRAVGPGCPFLTVDVSEEYLSTIALSLVRAR